MYVGPRLRNIISRLGTAPTVDALRERLAKGARLMGFEYVTLVQHGGLPRLFEGALLVTNYPPAFVRSYLENHQYVFDPVFDVVEQLERPFTWDEIPRFVDMTEKQVALFDEARSFGLAYGATIPLHIPGEPGASCTFARARPIKPTPDLMTSLHVISAFAFNAALHLHHPRRRTSRPKLTRREAECTALVALGKTDWEIAKILGLGATTVKYFVSAAKQRYGVYKRSELVARALMDAQLMTNETTRDPQKRSAADPASGEAELGK